MTHGVREFVEAAGGALGLDIAWEGSGPDELGRDRKTGRVLVRVDAKLWRPTEVEALVGDASKARERLGWAPRVGFEELVGEMVEADVAAAGAAKEHQGLGRISAEPDQQGGRLSSATTPCPATFDLELPSRQPRGIPARPLPAR